MISKFAAITSLEDKYNWAAGSEGSYSKGGCLDDMKVSAKHQLYQLYESIIPQLNYFSEVQDIIYRPKLKTKQGYYMLPNENNQWITSSKESNSC